jgi:molybdate transport system substrate-binding protein
MFRRSFLLSIATAATISFASAAVPAAAAEKLIVFAAASLKGSLDNIAKAYEKKSGNTVAISYAASGPLAKQIEAAAPADIFISADTRWMDYVVKAGAVKKEDAVNLLGNRLVLVTGKDSKISLKIGKGFELAKAIGDSRLAMGEVKSVPAGTYGKQALEYYGVWKDVEKKIAFAENVRAALKLVTTGEAPLGIVYETDATAEKGVKVVDTFGEESHKPIVYPVAPIATSKNPATKEFFEFLRGPEATEVFKQAGFTVMAGS